MSVTSYYSFGGEIIGEETGGVRRDYLTDALGSVTATVTGAGVIENTYRYKPYGSILAKTGAGNDPKFLWNGKSGYFTGSQIHFVYVRRRFYLNSYSRWVSLDPAYSEEGYIYSYGNPVSINDFSGLKPPQLDKDCSKNCFNNQKKVDDLNILLSSFCKYINNPDFLEKVMKCARKNGTLQDGSKQCFLDFCKRDKPILCKQVSIQPMPVAPGQTPETLITDGCKSGVDYKCPKGIIHPPRDACGASAPDKKPNPNVDIRFCCFHQNPTFAPYWPPKNDCPSYPGRTLFHEIGHACMKYNIDQKYGHDPFGDKFGQCILDLIREKQKRRPN